MPTDLDYLAPATVDDAVALRAGEPRVGLPPRRDRTSCRRCGRDGGARSGSST